MMYQFSDEEINISAEGARQGSLRIISKNGLSDPVKIVAQDGTFQLQTQGEGIYILKPEDAKEIRWLVMDPPKPVHPDVLRAALPQNGDKLLKGEPFRLLSMGDSVTATGDYEGMLKMMLARATGNQKIEIIDRSYPGRSVDASVRNYQKDAVETQPDAVMIMYGLNDQGAGASLAGYLEQFAWLVNKIHTEQHADPIALLPTPDLSRGAGADDYSASLFRTMGYATWLKLRLAPLGVPVVDTFHALWGPGGKDLNEAAQRMYAYYPLHYKRPFSSMLESGGKGDGVHPNALGHLAMAKAVYTRLTQPEDPPTLQFEAESQWTDEGLRANIQLTSEDIGRIEVYPLPHDQIDVTSFDDNTFSIKWPNIRKPEDLLQDPANRYFFSSAPMVILVRYDNNGGSRVYGAIAASEIQYEYEPARQVVTNLKVDVSKIFQGKLLTEEIEIPVNSEVGRIPLISVVEENGKKGVAAAELAYVRFAAASKGEAVLDGKLEDWPEQHWIPVGEAVQARWTHGPEDHRSSPEEFFTRWTFKAGEKGLYVAVKIAGDIGKDRATLFFDPRQTNLLGSPGCYYWVNLGFEKDGRLKLAPGETSPSLQPTLQGIRNTQDNGTVLEFFVPYTLIGRDSWPESGDLGLSIDWAHQGIEPDAPITHLQWSEDGHPWNPRWYGVLRLTEDPTKLPYRIRIE